MGTASSDDSSCYIANKPKQEQLQFGELQKEKGKYLSKCAEWKYQNVLSVGIEPTTLGLLDPRSNQLSYEGVRQSRQLKQ